MGLDANADNLRETSGRAIRSGFDNLVYVRAAVETLPRELAGVADRVTIVLPWGSLLAAVLQPSVGVLRGIAGLCRPGAAVTVLLGIDPVRDGPELIRLGFPEHRDADWRARLSEAYAAAGLDIVALRTISMDELAAWQSTWAKRLAHGRPRPAFLWEARPCDAG